MPEYGWRIISDPNREGDAQRTRRRHRRNDCLSGHDRHHEANAMPSSKLGRMMRDTPSTRTKV